MTTIIRLQLACISHGLYRLKPVVHIFLAMLITVAMFMSSVGLSLALNLP